MQIHIHKCDLLQEIGNQYNSKEKQILINHICCTGCHKTGYYTSNCSIPCPDVYCQHCHIETGACQGCKPGQQCELGKYSVMNVIFFCNLEHRETIAYSLSFIMYLKKNHNSYNFMIV